MAKRSRGKVARQQKPRTRRPAVRAQGTETLDRPTISDAEAQAVPAAGPSATPSPARRAAPRRGAAVAAIDYAYLRRDLLALAILDPAMIVLLIIAYFVLR